MCGGVQDLLMVTFGTQLSMAFTKPVFHFIHAVFTSCRSLSCHSFQKLSIPQSANQTFTDVVVNNTLDPWFRFTSQGKFTSYGFMVKNQATIFITGNFNIENQVFIIKRSLT